MSIIELTEQQKDEMAAAKAFCAALRQEFGPVYVDFSGNHYVEVLAGRWMHFKLAGLVDSRP